MVKLLTKDYLVFAPHRFSGGKGECNQSPFKKIRPLSAGMVFLPSYLLDLIISGMLKQQISNPLRDVYIDTPKEARVKEGIIKIFKLAFNYVPFWIK